MEENSAAEGCYPATERRSSARYDFSGDIEIEWDSKRVWGRTKNISRSGMFIEIPDPPDLGSHFFASLALHSPLRIECRVRRVVTGRGIGVSIAALGKEGRMRYEALLVALALGSDPIAAGAQCPLEDESQRPLAACAR